MDIRISVDRRTSDVEIGFGPLKLDADAYLLAQCKFRSSLGLFVDWQSPSRSV